MKLNIHTFFKWYYIFCLACSFKIVRLIRFWKGEKFIIKSELKLKPFYGQHSPEYEKKECDVLMHIFISTHIKYTASRSRGERDICWHGDQGKVSVCLWCLFKHIFKCKNADERLEHIKKKKSSLDIPYSGPCLESGKQGKKRKLSSVG